MRIVAYIDRSEYALSVCRHAAWAATKLQLPVALVHAIQHPASEEGRDLSGYFAIDAPETVLEDRVEHDEIRNRVILEDGHRLLDSAANTVRGEGVTDVSERLFQGTIADHLKQHQAETAMVIVGKRGEATARDPNRLGSTVEGVVRSAHFPVMVAAATFEPIERVVIAWDGGRNVAEAVGFISTSGLLSGIEATLLHVGERGDRSEPGAAVIHQLEASGVSVALDHRSGRVAETIVQSATDLSAQLIVMGAFSQSRIRHLVSGSTTREVLRVAACSVLVTH